LAQLLYNVTWGRGVLKKMAFFCYIICGRPPTVALDTSKQCVSGLISNNVLSTGQQTSRKTIVGMCQGRKTALRTLVITFDTAQCSCLFKRFNFSVRKTA